MQQDYKFLTLDALRSSATCAMNAGDWGSVGQHAIAFQQFSLETTELGFMDFQRTRISQSPSSEMSNVDLHLGTNIVSTKDQTFCPDWRADPDFFDHYRRRIFIHNGKEAMIFAPSRVAVSGVEVVI